MATERHRKPENYLSAIARNGHGLSIERTLDPETQAMEALLMGLRLAEGLDLERVADRSGVPLSALIDDLAAERLTRLGLLDRDGARITVTPQGMPLLDAILADVVAIEPATVA